jgi:hypothetical protein
MNPMQNIRRRFAVQVLALVLLVGTANRSFASWDYGNGRHGYFVLTTNATVEQLYQAVRLTNDPAQYNPVDSNAIPNFQNLTITNGATLTVNPWNGSVGGHLVFKVQSKLVVASGSAIAVNGLGYRGGSDSISGQYSYGVQGESYAGNPTTSSSANYGGGGGSSIWSISNGHPNYTGGGAGGGYGGAGESSLNNFCGCGASGGGVYGTPGIDTLYLGSGGGGGPGDCAAIGGNGGGAIEIHAGNVLLNGQIQANGAVGGYGSCGSGNVNGGGGSGGSIKLLVASASFGTNNISAIGGSAPPLSKSAGNGGEGRVAIYYAENVTGTTTPQAYTLFDSNSDNVTLITNQPAAQTSFLGSNAVFSVGAAGFPPLFYQWSFNGIPISNATNQTLLLANLEFTNQGDYSTAISNVVGTVISSNAFLTVLDPRNPFGDGIPNWWKTQYGLSLIDPTLATNHPFNDSLTYQQKYLYGINPTNTDSDGDGLSDYSEIFTNHTSPLSANTSGDGIPDGWKVHYGLNPLITNANSEIGSSGVTYWQVYQYNLTHTNQLDPRNPFFSPGTSIFEAINNGQHTNKFYYDHEDRLLGAEYSRGISIAYRYDGNDNLTNQSVLARANETNGLPLLWRYLNNVTNINPFADSDGDGWSDYQEWTASTDPQNTNSAPNFSNPGISIASLSLPFTPSNFVVGVGQLDSLATDEIVVGADGHPGTNINFMLVLTRAAAGWSTQRVDVGSFGITSIAVGQLTNRPTAGIYVGLRGTTNGSGRVMEFTKNGGTWLSNLVCLSTNQVAVVLGVRGQDALVSLATTNAPDGSLSVANFTTNWNLLLVDTNASRRGLGTIDHIGAGESGLRLLDTGGIEIGQIDYSVPTNVVYWASNGMSYFLTPSETTWSNAQSYAQSIGGNLATVTGPELNSWLRTNFVPSYWIGLFSPPGYNNSDPNSGWIWISGSNSVFRNWDVAGGQPNGGAERFAMVASSGGWHDQPASATGVGLVELPKDLSIPGSKIPEPAALNRIYWSGTSLASGSIRLGETNGNSVFYVFGDDANGNNRLDAGDDFVTAEYLVNGTNSSLLTLDRRPITTVRVSQSYGLASVNYLNQSNDVFFTGEPDGEVFMWTAAGTNSLQPQVFSASYLGKAWHALVGVQTFDQGKALAGLMVDPTNQSTCNIVLWSPQTSLPKPPNITETAPFAAVIPSSYPLGSNAVVNVRLWDNEGNASTPFLEYQFIGATNWQNATVGTLDGSPFISHVTVAAQPSGSDHVLVWNALADVGGNRLTNVLLRARAQDFMLVGDWSLPTPFQLDTTLVTNPNPTNIPVLISGITLVPGGLAFSWQGDTNLVQYLQRSPALAGTNASWVNIWTGFPPTPITGSYTDFFGTNQMQFYRLKIGTP